MAPKARSLLSRKPTVRDVMDRLNELEDIIESGFRRASKKENISMATIEEILVTANETKTLDEGIAVVMSGLAAKIDELNQAGKGATPEQLASLSALLNDANTQARAALAVGNGVLNPPTPLPPDTPVVEEPVPTPSESRRR